MKLKKYLIIIIILLILLGIFLIKYSDSVYTNVYVDGENVTTYTLMIPFLHDSNTLNGEINSFTVNEMSKPNSKLDDIKTGIYDICKKHGYKDIDLSFSSQFGENQLPLVFEVKGESMIPTLKDGQDVVILKTDNIKIGDIIVANDTKYGMIVKRVSDIKGSQVHLESDNKNIRYEEINGSLYEIKGLNKWIDSSRIYGVVKIY